MTPANQGHVPFGPEVSWPAGYSDPEYASGDYRYPATRAEQLPALGQGAHPYAAFGGQATAMTVTPTPATRARPRRTRGSRAPGRFADS